MILDHLAAALVRGAMEGGIVITAIWLACRLFPQIPACVRSTLWWLAALKLVVGLASPVALELPLLPREPGDVAYAGAVRDGDRPTPAGSHGRVDPRPGAAIGTPDDERWRALTAAAPRALVAMWLVAVALWGLRLWHQWRQARQLVRGAAAAPLRVIALAATAAVRMGLRRSIDVRESTAIESPQVIGLLRPVILVPSGAFDRLSPAEQAMALCHEVAHLCRWDLWLGIVPALAERLFFFHPLAHLATREYRVAREAACDAAVLEVLDASPMEYGRLLIALGVSRRGAMAAANAPHSFSILKRRLSMLATHASSHRAWRRAGWVAAAVTACAVLPIRLVAAPERADDTARPPTVRPLKPALAAEPAAARASIDARPVQGAVRPARPGAPVTPVLAEPPAAGRGQSSAGDRREPWVLFKQGERHSMSGSGADRAAAERHRKGDEPMLWFRRGGKEYVVRDAALLQRIETAFAPLETLGEQMGAIGKEQGALGSRQGEYGSQQGTLGARQGALGAQQGALGARMGALQARRAHERLTDAERATLDKEQAAIEAEMQKLAREMETLGVEMEKLAVPMEDLGRQMEAHGRDMEALGKKMEAAAAKAEAEVRQLMDEAVSSGRAEDVR